jgi:hypothetical protein
MVIAVTDSPCRPQPKVSIAQFGGFCVISKAVTTDEFMSTAPFLINKISGQVDRVLSDRMPSPTEHADLNYQAQEINHRTMNATQLAG